MPAAPAPESTASRRIDGRGFAALILANFCLSFGPWLVRLAEIGPLASAFWRMAIGAPLLLLIVCASRQPLPALRPALIVAIVAAAIFFAIDLDTWHLGIVRTRLANATLFANITSFFFAGYGFIVARRLPRRHQTIALLLAAAGVVLLAGRSYELSAAHLAGDMLCITAGLAYTGYLIVLDRARAGVAPLPLLMLVSFASIVPLAAVALASGEPLLPHDWTALVLLAIGSQVVGQGLILFALGRVPPIVVGLALMTQPVISATLGWTFYGERLTPGDFAGAFAIGVALVLVRGGD